MSLLLPRIPLFPPDIMKEGTVPLPNPWSLLHFSYLRHDSINESFTITSVFSLSLFTGSSCQHFKHTQASLDLKFTVPMPHVSLWISYTSLFQQISGKARYMLISHSKCIYSLTHNAKKGAGASFTKFLTTLQPILGNFSPHLA